MGADGMYEITEKGDVRPYPIKRVPYYTWWQLLIAKVFGRRIETPGLTSYLFRGKYYITRQEVVDYE